MICSLYKALSRNKNSLVVGISTAVVGLYTGYLLWYMLTQYFQEPVSSYRGLVSFISVWICVFLAIYQLPDLLCTNRHMKNILYYPVTVQMILFTILIRVIVIQFGICVAAAWPQFLFYEYEAMLGICNILACWIVVCAIDVMIVFLSVAISRIFSSQTVGYAYVVFQYGSFLLLAVLAKNIISLIFIKPEFLSGINELLNLAHILIFAIPVFPVLAIAMIAVTKHWYINGYLNVQNFRYASSSKHITTTQIENPYFLVEWKRVSRNKELIFFSNVKNILTIMVLCSLLSRNFGGVNLNEKYVMELFLLVSCCGVNTISSTAYSSDANKMFYGFLPVKPCRMFLWKTVQGFLWGEITMSLFWLAIVLFQDVPVLDAGMLFLYGTFTNYACSWLGVYLDFKMPRTTNSTNELLHGNLSKVFVLVFSVTITIGELYIVNNNIFSLSLLPLSVAVSAFWVSVEIGFWLFFKGAFYDTDK